MKNRRLVVATAIAHSNRELSAAHSEFHSGILHNSRFLTGRQKLKGRPKSENELQLSAQQSERRNLLHFGVAASQWITFSRKVDLKIGLAKHFKWNHIIHTFRVFDAKQLQVLTFRRCLRHQARVLCKKKTFCALNSDVIKSKSWRLKIPPFAMRLAKLQLWTGDWWTCTFRNSLQAVKSRTEQPTELKNL